MDLVQELRRVSEKAAKIARLCRADEHLFALLVQQKKRDGNPRFVEDFKTLADVLIQELVKHDLGRKFPDLVGSIFGEENNSFTNKLGETVTVEIREDVEQTSSLLKTVLNGDELAASLLSQQLHEELVLPELEHCDELQFDLKNLAFWIDPIDSTNEYISGIETIDPKSGICLTGLSCATVLIGVYDKRNGCAILGVINQPFYRKECDGSWSGKFIWGTPCIPKISSPLPQTRIICVSSSEDQILLNKLKASNYQIVQAAGAGYKILTVITGLADAYILSKNSTFKWDTCGPQAILKSLGGDILTYDSIFSSTKSVVTYGGKETCNFGGIIAYRDEKILNEILESLI